MRWRDAVLQIEAAAAANALAGCGATNIGNDNNFNEHTVGEAAR
jgi:hypothetical protein